MTTKNHDAIEARQKELRDSLEEHRMLFPTQEAEFRAQQDRDEQDRGNDRRAAIRAQKEKK